MLSIVSLMSFPISLDMLPQDLATMIACEQQELKEIVPITGLAGKHLDEGATYRVTFRNGTRAKARSWPRFRDASFMRQTLERLPSSRFPRMLAVDSRASLEQWFDGDPISSRITTAEILLEGGRLLGLIHQTNPPIDKSQQGYLSTNGCVRRLETKLDQLVSQKVIDRRLSAKIWEIAIARRPLNAHYGLAHRDFCGENLLICHGKVCCIDNTTFATLALDEDLARTWYRWPMSDANWRIFLKGYAETRDIEPFLQYGLFWKANVLTASILLRLRSGLPVQAKLPLNRLLATIQTFDGGDGQSVLRAA